MVMFMYFDSVSMFKKTDEMRLAKGWSLYRLAELSDISVNTLYGWRDNGSMPTLTVIEKIANAFQISPISLLLKDDEVSAIQQEHKELFSRWNILSGEQKESLMSLLRTFTREID